MKMVQINLYQPPMEEKLLYDNFGINDERIKLI